MMPRRRFLSPEFFKDEDLATLPYEARLLFQGLWCYADREGRLEDRPKYLKAELFPYDRVDIEKLLCLLASPAIPDRPAKVFIRRYRVDSRQLIDIPEFFQHQSPHKHEPDGMLPAFVGTTTDNVRRTIDIVGSSTDTCPSVIDKGERTKERGQRREDKGERTKDKTGKKPCGEFKNVLLSDHELEKLAEKFGQDDAQRQIENLGQYLASKGDRYKSHYATILQWAARGKETPNGHDPRSPLSKVGQETKANMQRLLARLDAKETEAAHDET